MNRRRMLLVLAPPVIVVLATWLLLWSPRSRAAAEQESRLMDLRTQQMVLETRVDKAEEFSEEDGRGELDKARTALPNDVDLGRFITLHEEMASAAGVEVLSVAPIPPEEADDAGIGEVEVSMSVLGERAQVIDYVDRLTQLPRLTEIGDVTLLTEGDGRTSADVRVVVHHRSG